MTPPTTFAGVITGSNGTLTKVGVGTMTLSGPAANTYTGLTSVLGGKLILGKTGAVNAIGGNLTIGAASGGTGTQIAQLVTGTDEIPNTALVTVNATGVFDINGVAEIVGNIAGSGMLHQYGWLR